MSSHIQQDLKRGVDYIGVCCVFVCHDGNGKFLLHKRSCNCRDEQGCWDCGGGAVEFGETFEEAARREIREEYGVEVSDLKFAAAKNVLRDNNGKPTHWVAVIFAAQVDSTQVKNNDPHKIEEIGWFASDQLPEPKHSSLASDFEAIREIGVI